MNATNAPKRTFHCFRSVLLLLCGFVLISSSGRGNDFNFFTLPPPSQAEPEDGAYWQETVDRALRDLESEDSQVRRDAVMVLGKYPAPQARAGVRQGLEDTTSEVRLAALVSLFENPRFYSDETAEKVIRLVGDSDASIRRIASNSLPMVLSGFSLRFLPGSTSPVRSYPDDVEAILQDAFQDEDVTVRRNMVSHMQNLGISLPDETLIALLHDPDREVAIQSLRFVRSQLPPQKFAEEARFLSEHSDRLFRVELTRTLASHHLPAAREALEILSEDADGEVAVEAALALFQQERSLERYDRLVDEIETQTPPQATLRRVIRAASSLGNQGKPYLDAWLDHSSPEVRLEVLPLYLPRFSEGLDAAFFVELLRDSSPEVRDYVLDFLQRNPQSTEPDILQALSANPYDEVRKAAAGFSTFIPLPEAEDILLELMLDDVTNVRMAALREIGNRRISGWEEILGFSLYDPDLSIQATALEGLFRTVTPETLSLLRAFAEDRPGSSLHPRIETHLERYDSTNTSG